MKEYRAIYGHLWHFKNALGVEGDDACKQILEIEDILYSNYRIVGWLYDSSIVKNEYRNLDTGEFLTHSQVMAMIG